APGGSRYGRAAPQHGNRVVRRQKILVVQGIQMPTGLQLFRVIQTGDGQCFLFGPAQRRQEESCENRDDSDYHQQFYQSERGEPTAGSSGVYLEKVTRAEWG